MMYKATLAFSLLFLAVVGSAHSGAGTDTSAQPSLTTSPMTDSSGSPSPTGAPLSTTPTPGDHDGDSNKPNKTGPKGCFPPGHNGPHSGLPSGPPPSGVPSSAGPDSSSAPEPRSNCEPNSEFTLPTGTGDHPAYTGGALPFSGLPFSGFPKPFQTGTDGLHHGHDSNTNLPTGSVQPISSSSGQDDLPVSTATSSFGKLGSL